MRLKGTKEMYKFIAVTVLAFDYKKIDEGMLYVAIAEGLIERLKVKMAKDKEHYKLTFTKQEVILVVRTLSAINLKELFGLEVALFAGAKEIFNKEYLKLQHDYTINQAPEH